MYLGRLGASQSLRLLFYVFICLIPAVGITHALKVTPLANHGV